MGKGNTACNDVLNLMFNATTFPWNSDTILYVALHTANPGASGNQQTSEANYTSYARVGVNRNSGGWTVSAQTAENTALISFPQCTGGSSTITYVSIGTNSSGTGEILYFGALTTSLAVSNLVQPQFAATNLQISEA
jgi:hypothetical protein